MCPGSPSEFYIGGGLVNVLDIPYGDVKQMR